MHIPMENQPFLHLLSQITAIRKQYEKIAELTGENFNIFKILNLTTNEVRTHSAFIAELLNTNGSHGKKETFLKLFIDQMKIEDFTSEGARIKVEQYLGNISADNTEGGYIDILVVDKNNHAIIIENKIYAGDQKCQLLRYYNYGNSNHANNFKLFYLTLDGKEALDYSKKEVVEDLDGKKASDNSKKELVENQDYVRISYAKDILTWLEQCKEKSVNQPLLRETLTQYIYLVKYLTGQTTNNQMNTDIVEKIVGDKNHLISLFTINKNEIINEVKRKLIERLKLQLKNIAEEFHLELVDEEFTFDTNDPFVCFNLRDHSIKGYSIDFGGSFGRFQYSIDCKSERNEFRMQIMNRLGKGLPVDKWGDNYVWLSDFEAPLIDWNNNPEPWLGIMDGSMKNNIREKVLRLRQSLEGLDI